MGKFKGRSSVACGICHSQKLKCDGAQPCGRCARRNRECIYAEKKTFVTVSESYIRELERAVASSQASTSLTPRYNREPDDPTHSGSSQSPQDLGSVWENRIAARVIMSDNCSAEQFVHDLRQMTLPNSLSGSQKQSGYTYIVLKSDFLEPRMVIKLPSAPLASKLLDTFEDIFCDYHWFLRRDFRERMALLFSDPENQTKDRSWLSRVSLVFALGTTFIHESRPSGGNSPPASTEPPLPPGSDMFEQAVSLLNVLSEEPTTDDVEALNLMAFYCYCLNRRRMAYRYATQSLAVAKLLHLDKRPISPREGDEVMLEHKKRLWWTSFCMERMVLAELGLSPAHARANIDLAPPTTENIPESGLNQFFDASILSLQTEICEIKCQIMEAVNRLRRVSDLETMLFELWPCFETLRAWIERVPPHLCFDFNQGVPIEMRNLSSARAVASLYLRYHQCFTFILRPFFSKELSLMLQSVDPKQLEVGMTTTQRQRIQILKKEGLQAARNNCRILLDLSARGKHAKFGYWDSVHAFSSLSIISISRAVAPDISESPQFNDDVFIYSQCRYMLREMAEAGNPASIDHHALLSDVESIVQGLVGALERDDFTDRPIDITSPSLDLCEHLWSDAEWVKFLNTCSQTI